MPALGHRPPSGVSIARQYLLRHGLPENPDDVPLIDPAARRLWCLKAKDSGVFAVSDTATDRCGGLLLDVQLLSSLSALNPAARVSCACCAPCCEACAAWSAFWAVCCCAWSA